MLKLTSEPGSEQAEWRLVYVTGDVQHRAATSHRTTAVQTHTRFTQDLLLHAPDNWKRRPPGRPRITWLNTVQHDLRAFNLTLNEAVIDLAQNRPLCRLMSAYGATHS